MANECQGPSRSRQGVRQLFTPDLQGHDVHNRGAIEHGIFSRPLIHNGEARQLFASTTNGKVCYSCGIRGHIARNCQGRPFIADHRQGSRMPRRFPNTSHGVGGILGVTKSMNDLARKIPKNELKLLVDKAVKDFIEVKFSTKPSTGGSISYWRQVNRGNNDTTKAPGKSKNAKGKSVSQAVATKAKGKEVSSNHSKDSQAVEVKEDSSSIHSKGGVSTSHQERVWRVVEKSTRGANSIHDEECEFPRKSMWDSSSDDGIRMIHDSCSSVSSHGESNLLFLAKNERRATTVEKIRYAKVKLHSKPLKPISQGNEMCVSPLPKLATRSKVVCVSPHYTVIDNSKKEKTTSMGELVWRVKEANATSSTKSNGTTTSQEWSLGVENSICTTSKPSIEHLRRLKLTRPDLYKKLVQMVKSTQLERLSS